MLGLRKNEFIINYNIIINKLESMLLTETGNRQRHGPILL